MGSFRLHPNLRGDRLAFSRGVASILAWAGLSAPVWAQPAAATHQSAPAEPKSADATRQLAPTTPQPAPVMPKPGDAVPPNAAPAGDTVLASPDPSAHPTVAGSQGPAYLPTETGASVGTPLPAPPASVPAAKIARGVWRGRVRLDAALNWSLPLPTNGTNPVSGDLFGVGADLSVLWRLGSVFGLGLRWGLNPQSNPDQREAWWNGTKGANRFVALARVYLPTEGRLVPFAEVGGGLVHFDATEQSSAERGQLWVAALGTDLWVVPGWTVWGAARYRGLWIERDQGHRTELALGASLHF